MDLTALPRTIAVNERAKGGVFVRLIDQRELPQELVFLERENHAALIDDIKTLTLRGAPAIGVGGAAALVLFALNESESDTSRGLLEELERVAPAIATARPTAINLAWAVDRLMLIARSLGAQGVPVAEMKQRLFDEIKQLEAQDEAANRAIGANGAELLGPHSRILTHCNAGSLATVFYGTALGVVYAAAAEGKIAHVFADETRPVGQGARLTVWELAQVGIPATLICDNMAASIMAKGQVDAVIVGADRICANGDVANKIGTYGLAILAKYHGIPFYVAAPVTSIDKALAAGNEIPIEERAASEVSLCIPDGVEVYNPAFDVTPANLITSLITDRGVFTPDQVNDI